ncbi:hypothetical protein PGT21_005538, partial [Puccinia graminis f. sp. tritici]
MRFVDAITGESSGRNSSEAPYSPAWPAPFKTGKAPASRFQLWLDRKARKGSG